MKKTLIALLIAGIAAQAQAGSYLLKSNKLLVESLMTNSVVRGTQASGAFPDLGTAADSNATDFAILANYNVFTSSNKFLNVEIPYASTLYFAGTNASLSSGVLGSEFNVGWKGQSRLEIGDFQGMLTDSSLNYVLDFEGHNLRDDGGIWTSEGTATSGLQVVNYQTMTNHTLASLGSATNALLDLAGTRTMTGGLLMGGQSISGVSTIQSSGAANIGGALTASNGVTVLAGNVGIGTNAPAVKLHLVGTGNILGRINGGVGSVNGLDIGDTTTTARGRFRTDAAGNVELSSSASDVEIFTAIGGTNQIYIDAGNHIIMQTASGADNVGIGTASPSTKLDVAGAIRSTGTATFGDTVTASNGVTVLAGGLDAGTNQLTAGGATFANTIWVTNGVAIVGGNVNLSVTGRVYNARYDSRVDPYRLLSTNGTAVVYRAYTDTIVWDLTNNAVLSVNASEFPTNIVGRFTIDINPQTYSLTLPTNTFYWTTAPTFTANTIRPTQFRKACGTNRWEVR